MAGAGRLQLSPDIRFRCVLPPARARFASRLNLSIHLETVADDEGRPEMVKETYLAAPARMSLRFVEYQDHRRKAESRSPS